MAYTALYRKFRPDDFEEVKGQDHIVTVLKNQIKSDRIGHAYLFCGTRGTGKTSVAKVLAKAVNCLNPKDGNPCNECELCRSIKAGTSMNVVEIDAASNNGVENIRDIIDEVKYAPTEGRYRVYIIDEVHMLSVSAFNALLKTLEEPPAYVVFILATTEAHKIPVTIMSRCQRYDFKRITVEMITSHLETLCKAEGAEADEKALRYIAGKADGAFRDAISLLDQCISFCFGEKLTYERVLEILGAVDIEVFAGLLRYIRKGDVAGCIDILTGVVNNGRDLTQFITDFIWYMRNLLVVKSTDGEVEIFDISGEQMKLLLYEASAVEISTLTRNITIFSELSNTLRHATQKRVLTELAMIRACMPKTENDDDALAERIRQIEDSIASGVALKRESGEEAGADDLPEVVPEALPEEVRQFAANWDTLLDQLSEASMRTMLKGATLTAEGGKLIIYLGEALDEAFFKDEANVSRFSSDIEKRIHRRVKFEFRYNDKLTPTQRKRLDITKINGIKVQITD